MLQPKSIERFEQIFFLSLVVSLVMFVLNWDQSMEAVQQNPAAAAIAVPMMIGFAIIGYGISILLWFLIARRGNEVAKWIYVVLFALGALGALIGVLMGGRPGVPTPSVLTRVGQIVNLVLGIAGVWFLFQPDTRPWFNKGVDPEA